jgi:site-specific recombinase XerD
MTNLFQRSNGFFYLLIESNGKRRWISTKTRNRSEALRFLVQFESNPKQSAKSPSLSAFIAELMPYIKANMAPGTAALYEKSFRFFQDFVKDIPLDTISLRLIDQYKTERLSKIKKVTVNIELRSLRAGFEHAVRWDILVKNPFRGVKLCSIDESRPNFLTPVQYKTLIDTIREPWFKQMVVLGALTGLRRNELLYLTWQNIDLNRRIIYLYSTPTFRTKNGKTRVVPLNESAIKIIRYCFEVKTGDYIFSFSNGLPVTGDHVSRMFRRYVEELGFDPELSFHNLRHTFASWLVQNGASLFEVQKLMGHSNPRVTEIYSHLLPQTLHHVVQLIDPGEYVQGQLR